MANRYLRVWDSKYYFSDVKKGHNNLSGNVMKGFTEEAAFEEWVHIYFPGR